MFYFENNIFSKINKHENTIVHYLVRIIFVKFILSFKKTSDLGITQNEQ